jgi:cytochrome c
MKKQLPGLLFGLFSLILHSQVCAAAGKGTAEEAVAMVRSAIAAIKANGKEKVFAEIADPQNTQFHDRDLYIYIYDFNGVTLAHGNNPKMVGKNLYELRDADGKPIVKELIELAKSKGTGWVDFKWPNPVTKKLEKKSGYIETVDGMFIGSGIYK